MVRIKSLYLESNRIRRPRYTVLVLHHPADLEACPNNTRQK
jgi:hypothetical protein